MRIIWNRNRATQTLIYTHGKWREQWKEKREKKTNQIKFSWRIRMLYCAHWAPFQSHLYRYNSAWIVLNYFSWFFSRFFPSQFPIVRLATVFDCFFLTSLYHFQKTTHFMRWSVESIQSTRIYTLHLIIMTIIKILNENLIHASIWYVCRCVPVTSFVVFFFPKKSPRIKRKIIKISVVWQVRLFFLSICIHLLIYFQL